MCIDDATHAAMSQRDTEILWHYRASRSWAATARHFDLPVHKIKAHVRAASRAERLRGPRRY